MNLNKAFVLAILFFLSFAVTAKSELIICGTEWINIHKGNVELIGIYVQQSPDNIEDEADYVGKHPAMIIYIFKNNRAHSVTYTPTGQVQEGVWWSIPDDHWVRSMASSNLNLDKACSYSLSANKSKN